MLNLTFSGTSEEVLADLKRIMPALLGGTPLPPMQEQPNNDAQPQKTTRTRKNKEAGEAETGESASTKENTTSDQTKTETPSQSAESAAAGGSSEIPDIEALRAALKKLGATDSFGHDKVFEVLSKYDVKTASALPEGKRAEVIATIEKMIAEGPKK